MSLSERGWAVDVARRVNTLEHRLGAIAASLARIGAGGSHGSGLATSVKRFTPRAGTDPVASDEISVDPDRLETHLSVASGRATTLKSLVDDHTVSVDPSLDEDAFFTRRDGTATVVNRYDLEKAVSAYQTTHLVEVERYWVNEPYAFVVVFHARAENEMKYFLVEPHLTPLEKELLQFLTEKLRATLQYHDRPPKEESVDRREQVIERGVRRLLSRYGLVRNPDSPPIWRVGLDRLPRVIGGDITDDGSRDTESTTSRFPSRPEPAVVEEGAPRLTEHQVLKLLYFLRRDFVGYGRIDAIKQDVNVEDISCDGYDSPVFVYHTRYENLITNVSHGGDDLDDFVIELAQRSGKAISKRRPQVDATLPDDSRAQLTLGREVSDHGTNYTIRQFRQVPFTPVDLINWRTFSLDQMAELWLAIENGRSMLFAGGTASGKTTTLNALSLFVPSNEKVVSIEDTREVELPHRNWIASITRPSLSTGGRGNVDQFDLLEAALRQRPDYIVMGEVRGEEGRTLFQITSTGHTTYTTFHAGSVEEVINRFTNAPIDVSKTLFTSIDLVSVQIQTQVDGQQVRRVKTITEITGYDPETDQIHTNDVYEWRADVDAFEQVGQLGVLSEIAQDRGWTPAQLTEALFERRVVLAYLVEHGLTTYAQVAATIQAYISDPGATLSLMATGSLADRLSNLSRIENVDIDVDDETEELVPRPPVDPDARDRAREILASADDRLFEQYRDGPAASHPPVAGEDTGPNRSRPAREIRRDGG